MNGILMALQGKKTYIIAALVVVLVGIEKFAGIDVPGFDPGQDWLAFILGALGLSSLRAGVAKSPSQ